MEKSIEEKDSGARFEECMERVLGLRQADAREYSPLTLAYIGDSIYDLVIKTLVVNQGNRPVNALHRMTSSLVQASAQSRMMRTLQEMLTEEEHAVYKRGRNAKSVSPARNQSVTDYRRATRRMSADMERNETVIEGRNAVLEALRAGRPVDRLYVQDGCKDGPVQTIIREARKHDTLIQFVARERLNQMSQTGHHQGVIAQAAAWEYAQVEDMLELARQKGEDPFLLLLDNVEDPHNLGAIIRTANLAGAHGVIIPKRRAVGLTATVARTSAGALSYTPVARVTNLVKTMQDLKEKGLWFVCADMGGEVMYDLNLTGPIGLVIGNEGEGVGRLVKENCDFTASIPMRGDIDSLNASVAAGVLSYEIVRQRLGKQK